MPQHIHPAATTLRDPSRLFYQLDYNRRLIIASYLVVLVAALPLWWQITSIERLSLPTAQVHSQAGNKLRFPVQIKLENTQDAFLASSLQQLLEDRIRKSPQAWNGLDVKICNPHDADELVGSYTIRANDGISLADQRHLTYPVRNETLPMLADVLAALLVPPTDVHRVAQYSTRYRLAFTLLNEDAAAGGAISGWDIVGAISRHLSPIINRLSFLYNFTIESQVQFQAPLAFSPMFLHGSYGLSPEHLTIFVNSAEWSLSSSVSNDPVLHFIVFVPSSERRPLQILDSHGLASSSDAFLLPQWGGIVIYNPPNKMRKNTQFPQSALNSVFSTFSTQLLALLGVPDLPPDVRMDAPVLTGWQLDALTRRRALENAEGAKDALESIVKLVEQIENMPVGLDVKGDVQDSLTALHCVPVTPRLSLAS
ncbi:phosphatidylinositol-glycan biosynthesis class S protein-domain-containing protein [Mycena capillaripes]|nr:phosphatidylinositol-glycan biosynthesis class S protein-domain-containing protein [Mycena capillaripes]